EGSGFRWPDAKVWLAIFITGGLASALAFWVQTFVQQRIRPARTAIILLGEPAFATAFAVWLGGERLNDLQWLGAGLILVSLLAHEAWMATRGGMVAQGVLG
ncbi:MAG TPA: DMT family transporter, partial [Chloroflexota bacterium]|nr:DMT family transporter [Chloroflexota bacterium]